MVFIHLENAEDFRHSDQPVVVLVPTEEVACHRVEVPPVPRKKWQPMLPWLLEDRVLSSPESLVIANGEKEGNQVPVVAVNKDTFDGWQQKLKELGVPYSGLVPDFFALPWQSGEVSLAISKGRWLLRYGQSQGAAGPQSVMAPLVQHLLSDKVLRVYGDLPEEGLPEFLHGADTLSCSGGLAGKSGVDWLSFAQGRTTKAKAPWPLPARLAAGLAALSLLLLSLVSWQESRQMQAQADYFEDQLRIGYRQYFGENYDFAMEDFQRVVSARLDSGTDVDSALGRFSVLADVLARCSGCQLENLNYSNRGVQALLSGEQVNQKLNSFAGVAMAPKGEQWLVTIDGGMR